jgi:hypothetical protein
LLATSANADDVPPSAAPAAEPDHCWLEVWNEADFKQGSLRLEGPRIIPKLADLGGADGENLNEDIKRETQPGGP